MASHARAARKRAERTEGNPTPAKPRARRTPAPKGAQSANGDTPPPAADPAAAMKARINDPNADAIVLLIDRDGPAAGGVGAIALRGDVRITEVLSLLQIALQAHRRETGLDR